MIPSTEETLSISGIDALDLRSLRKALPETAFQTSSTRLGPSEHGDLGTTAAIVAISALTLKVLAVWLAKNRRDKEVFVRRSRANPDGTFEHFEVCISQASSDSDSAVLKQLMEGLQIDLR